MLKWPYYKAVNVFNLRGSSSIYIVAFKSLGLCETIKHDCFLTFFGELSNIIEKAFVQFKFKIRYNINLILNFCDDTMIKN